MCGRFAVTRETPDLIGVLEGLGSLSDNFNVAPTTPIAAVREWKGERHMETPRWGFVPSFYKSFDQRPQPINARVETVATSGMFRKGFANSRCIVPARGYFEWQVRQDGKQPYFISAPESALAMAGVMTAWRDPAKADDDPDRWRLSVAIITRDAHVAPGEVHDRMPACLTPDAYDDWLGDHLSADQLLSLLDRSSAEVAHELTHWEVSRDVNSVRNNGPQLIEPLA
ncbi:SOS response-associated peptidase [Lysobacter korlensis]|uniref:Abasic site processing protein n=1 Tax=Lysobacter korlensis TaxID=553636 RepID=A0ABV6RQ37_9GAMM